MAAIQLNFTLRTTPACKTVHLLGSWDNYQGQLPLSRESVSKSTGNWTGTFRFTGGTMQQGQRYWYYYIMDGYHCTHDPAHQSVLEPTTQRKLNILDVPASKTKTSTSEKRSSRRMSKDVPRGRAVSPSQIKSPKPYNPVQTAHIRQGYTNATVDELTQRFGYANLEESDSDSDSDADSDVPSLTSSRSSASSSPSSVSSSSSCCSCERYGITRSGNRVKLDCGGKRCGYSDDSSSCASDEDVDYKRTATRRHGVVIRG